MPVHQSIPHPHFTHPHPTHTTQDAAEKARAERAEEARLLREHQEHQEQVGNEQHRESCRLSARNKPKKTARDRLFLST